MPNGKVRLFLADSQQLFRQGIKTTFATLADIEICGEESVSGELIDNIENVIPHVVLLGIRSDADLDLARNIKQGLPSTSIIVMAPVFDDNQLFLAIKARAAAYLDRSVSSDKLLEVVRRAANGEHPINDALLTRPKVAERVLQQFQDLSWGRGVEAFLSPLTNRETQILRYMAQGYLNKQIAAELSLSEQTIKNHITSILRKLDANARTQAVVNAIRRGLIDVKEVKQF
jgi:DNA-binding NarL/FixJ family response regulator